MQDEFWFFKKFKEHMEISEKQEYWVGVVS